MTPAQFTTTLDSALHQAAETLTLASQIQTSLESLAASQSPTRLWRNF